MRNISKRATYRPVVICLTILAGLFAIQPERSLGCSFCTPSGTGCFCTEPQFFHEGKFSLNDSPDGLGDNPYADFTIREICYDYDDDVVRQRWEQAKSKDNKNSDAPEILEVCYDWDSGITYTCELSTVLSTATVSANIPTAISACGCEIITVGSCNCYSATLGLKWKMEDLGWNQKHTLHTTKFTAGLDVRTQVSFNAKYDNGTVDKEYPSTITTVRDSRTTQIIYYTYTLSSGRLARLRKTVVKYLQNGGKSYHTTLYIYYPASWDPTTSAGKLRYVIEPDGVVQYLGSGSGHYDQGINPSSPGNTCVLDTVSADYLATYAAREYKSYYDDGRIASMTGAGCGGCGGSGGDGTYEFKYGNNDNYGAGGRNVWKTFQGTKMPGGKMRKAQYLNSDGQIIYDIVQEMGDNNSIVNVWATHYTYYTSGGKKVAQVNEKRHPSACKSGVYTYTDSSSPADGWIDSITAGSGSSGLVEVYDYSESTGQVISEKVRNGTQSGDDYWVRKYTYYSPRSADGFTISRLHEVMEYPTQSTSDSGYNTTTYEYEAYYSTSNAVHYEKITYPAVTTDHNGNNSGAVVRHHYERDTSKNLYYRDMIQHEDLRWSYTGLGVGVWDRGQVVKTIEDADKSGGGVPGFDTPTGWTTPTGGLNLTTVYSYYEPSGSVLGGYGRLRSVLSPGGQKSAYAYVHQYKTGGSSPTKETTTRLVTLTTPHMDGDDDYDYAPVQITVSDLAGRTVISAAGPATSDEDGDLANDWTAATEGIAAFVGTIRTKSVNNYNDKGQLTSSDSYYMVSATPANEKKLTTSYTYDETTGRQYITEAPDGTFTWTEFDAIGRAVATYVGTQAGDADEDDHGTLVQVSATEYDNGDVGDGLVTKTKAYRDDNNSYDTTYHHDFRGRRDGARGPDGVATATTLDNLGRAKQVEVFKENGTPDFARNSEEKYLSLSTTDYDERGQVWQTAQYRIGSNGYVSSGDTVNLTTSVRLTTLHWYDARGRQIKTRNANGLFNKQSYDTAGRLTASYICYDDDEPASASTTLAEAANVSDDIVIEQTKQTYDDKGNVWLTEHFRRYDNAPANSEGALQYPTGSDPKAVVTYSVNWFDELGRARTTAYYGTYGGQQITSQPAEPTPGASADVIVTKYDYSADTGRLTATYDNKNRKTTRQYDDLGRTTSVIENDVETPAGADEDRTTEYAYDSRGRQARITAKNSTTGDQETYYFFWDTDYDTNNNNQASGSLVTAVKYPDSGITVTADSPSAGLWSLGSGTDRVAYAYDRLGRKTSATDQRQVVHAYAFSTTTGALLSDTVTFPGSLPAGLDNTIRKIAYDYDDFGRTTKVSTWDSTEVVNEVELTYGDWGVVVESAQEHTGEVSSSPTVSYEYEDGAGQGIEAKYLRPDYVTYPGPSTRRKVYYNYASTGVGAPLSRLDNIADDDDSPTDTYAAYTYLGASTLIKVAYPAVTDTLALTYGTSANSYSGFDRFGRVVDQKWQIESGPTVKDRYTYGYDLTGNRLYRKNELKDELGELYHANGPSGQYDGLDRLTDFRRGALSDTNSDNVPDTVATVSRIQAWSLDPVGNWSGFKSTVATTQPWDLDQTRTHNKANEIEHPTQPLSDIAGTPNWVDPNYDAAGNMTAGPQPRYETADANTQLYVYDAWNRLTKIYQDANCNDTIDDPSELVVTYSYDGQNRRIRKAVAGDDTYDYYYNESWQVLEVQKASRTNKTYQQYVWGIQYVDAPVAQFRDTADDGTLDETLYYTYDAQFNVTALVELDGDVVERYVYDPYGQVTIYDGTWSSTRASSSFDNCIMYCGYWFDKESGNYIARRRYFTPPLGRWLTTDPIGYGDGMNRYQYVGGSPLGQSDPTGQATQKYMCGIVTPTILGFVVTRAVGSCTCTGLPGIVLHPYMFEASIPCCYSSITAGMTLGRSWQPTAMTACMQVWVRSRVGPFALCVSCTCT